MAKKKSKHKAGKKKQSAKAIDVPHKEEESAIGDTRKETTPTCLRDGTVMEPFKEGDFTGFRCPECGYFEGVVKPIPKKKPKGVLEECPQCGAIKAVAISEEDQIGLLCTACGYSAGRRLQRVTPEKFDELDKELASLREKVDERLLKVK
ncbi:MAG: hypothetical protein ACTSW4_04315 [Candidatus Ranarchaeia archaeon]